VLFDFGGTLDAPGRPWKDRIFGLYREEGVDVPPERFDPVFYRVDDGLVGTIPTTLPFGETVRRLVAGVSAGLAIASADVGERVACRFVDDARARLCVEASLLSRLAQRYRLGIVSNFYGNLTTICQETGIAPFFTVVVDSARVGSMKPDPRIFRHALDALSVEPAEAALVGDSLSRDMAGARALTMPHIWLMGETVVASRPCCPHDPVIRSLEDLQGLLL
jgi:FMN phosphatase YigB (HAD superfamily)